MTSMRRFPPLALAAALLLLAGLPALAQDDRDADSYASFMAEKKELEERLEKRDQVIDRLQDQVTKMTRDLEDQRRRIQVCATDPSLASRMVCYDEIARDYGYKTSEDIKTQEEKVGDHGFWRIVKKLNEMGDEVIYLKVDSVEPVVTRAGTRRTPTFTIRCVGGKTDAYIDWKAALADYKVFIQKQQVSYKIDGSSLIDQDWELSQDNHAAFAPDPIEFIKKLTGRSKLALIITPYTDKSATLIFPLQGLPTALNVLVERCYNPKKLGQ